MNERTQRLRARFLAFPREIDVERVEIITDSYRTNEDVLQIVRRAVSLGIKDVYLLPYHEYGVSKYRFLDREYRHVRVADSLEVRCRTQKIMQELPDLGARIRIGG